VRVALASIFLAFGCAAHRGGPPAVAAPASAPATSPAPTIDQHELGYWVWHEGEVWRVRTTAADHPHRFQGSVEGTSGGIVEVRTDDAALLDHVAQVGNSVQFDYDAGDGTTHGFDARITGGCLRFDLLVDGKRRPERVHFGPGAEAPARLPAERCP